MHVSMYVSERVPGYLGELRQRHTYIQTGGEPSGDVYLSYISELSPGGKRGGRGTQSLRINNST